MSTATHEPVTHPSTENGAAQSPSAMAVTNVHLNMFGTSWVGIPHEEQAKLVKEIPYYRPQGPTAPSFNTPPASPPSTLSGVDPDRSVKSAGGVALRPSPHAAAVKAELQGEQGKVKNTFLSFGNTCWLRERYAVEEQNNWPHQP